MRGEFEGTPHGDKTGAALATTIMSNVAGRLRMDCRNAGHNPAQCYCEACAVYNLAAELYRNMLRMEMEAEHNATRTTDRSCHS